MDDPLYREEILDHYYSSPYRGRLERADHACDLDNPFCGDQIHVELAVDGDRIKDVRFDGKGCVISQAATSLLAERLEGHPPGPHPQGRHRLTPSAPFGFDREQPVARGDCYKLLRRGVLAASRGGRKLASIVEFALRFRALSPIDHFSGPSAGEF